MSSHLESVTWADFTAFRLTNAHLRITIVPALGRVMSFSRIGGPEHLWTDTLRRTSEGYVSPLKWPNWGGDKTWIAPDKNWREFAGPGPMGDPAWGEPIRGEHTGAPLHSSGLRVTGPVSTFSGLRLSRDYFLDGNELLIIQRAENSASPTPRIVSLWSVTNVPKPDLFFALPAAHSAYPGGFRNLSGGPSQAFQSCGPLLTYRPPQSKMLKFGLDSDYASLAALRAGEVFIQRAERPPGDYPDGAPGLAGLCVEYFETGSSAPLPYAELELLGPSITLALGESTTHAVRWRILPNLPDSETLADLLRAPVAATLSN